MIACPACRGRRELRVVAEERVQPGMDVQTRVDRLEDDRAPCRRQLAARRRDPEQQAVGPTGAASASDSAPTNGMSWPGQDSLTFCRHRRVEDRDDVVAAVADDAVAVLASSMPNSLREDDESAGLGRQHRRSLRNRQGPARDRGDLVVDQRWAAR
jgi:uncharacterized protein YbaR (Trm112 family)